MGARAPHGEPRLTRAAPRARALGAAEGRHERGGHEEQDGGHEEQRDDELDLRRRLRGVLGARGRPRGPRLGRQRRERVGPATRRAGRSAGARRRAPACRPRGSGARAGRAPRRPGTPSATRRAAAPSSPARRPGMAAPHLGERAPRRQPGADGDAEQVQDIGLLGLHRAAPRCARAPRSHASGSRKPAAGARHDERRAEPPGRERRERRARPARAAGTAAAFSAITSPTPIRTPAASIRPRGRRARARRSRRPSGAARPLASARTRGGCGARGGAAQTRRARRAPAASSTPASAASGHALIAAAARARRATQSSAISLQEHGRPRQPGGERRGERGRR